MPVAGNFPRESKYPRANLVPTWLIADMAEYLSTARQIFVNFGGYLLPREYWKIRAHAKE